MPERLKLYLDQMLNVQVAEALRDEGYDVVRASEAGQMTIRYSIRQF